MMAAQRGNDLQLKVQDATGALVMVAGLRSRVLAFNAQTIDVTHQDTSDRWRTLLAGAGLRSVRVTGAGIFKDAASDALVRTAFFTGDLPNWQILIPDFGVIAGPFQITALTFSAHHDGEVTFDISLASAGPVTFIAL
jgi:TP901-1 family phage major tail protein